MNIIEFAIGFVLVIAAFVLGFCIGVKAGANGTLKVVKLATDETLADVQKNEFLKSLERNKRRSFGG